MDWGAYVIVAAIIWPNGQVADYHPTTLFDKDACIREAIQINDEWREEGRHGFASCMQAP